jgi:CRISPR-associated protein Cmr2
MTHLFLFSFGPVQSFIVQARKTKDLKAGSEILSKLTKAAIKCLNDSNVVAQVIYPFQDGNSLPNKFLASVEVADDKSALSLGKKVEDRVKAKFMEIAIVSKNEMNLVNTGKDFETAFEEQIESHLEVFWLFEPVNTTYKVAHNNILRNLGAIKNCRPFAQLPDGENGRKCAVSGERDALIFPDEELPAYVNDDKIAKCKNANEILLSKGEGLSAVVAVKRFYKSEVFPSTAGVASMDFVNAINSGGPSIVCFEKYKQNFNGSFDYQLLYKENLTPDYFKKQGLATREESKVENLLEKRIRNIKDDHKLLIESMSFSSKEVHQDATKLKSYYALLQFDGDKMGPTWSGDYCKDGIDLMEFQTEVAKRLHNFAKLASNFLIAPQGCTIYAGGDDFSGFVNLTSLFDVIQDLRKLYRKEVHEKVIDLLDKSKLQKAELSELSFSAGVVVAHYKTPLGEVVGTAHRTQSIAKEKGGRDSCAITLLKKSGEIQEGYVKWIDLQYLVAAVKNINKGYFSGKFLQSLEIELMNLVGREAKECRLTGFDPIIKAEIKRLVTRSLQIDALKKDNPNLDKEQSKVLFKDVADGMVETITRLYDAARPKHLNAKTGTENFVHLLSIIDFFTRKLTEN